MSDLAVGPSRAAGDSFTDAGISRGERFERELVAWAPTEGDGLADAGGLLEDPAARSKNGTHLRRAPRAERSSFRRDA